MPHISVVAPVFNESACLDEFHRRVSAALASLADDYEIVLVDDGSQDDSWRRIEALSVADPHVVGVRFSRNFGHHLSITAGIDHAAGEWVVVMDSDLQDPPEAIPELHAEACRGFDHVTARRTRRADSWFKRTTSSLFYRVHAWLIDAAPDTQSSGVFRIMSRRFVDALRQMREAGRFFPGMADWVGFPRSSIGVEHAARHAGETKYPLHKQLALAMTTAVSFSDKPLLCVFYGGLAMSASSLAAISVLLGLTLSGRRTAGTFDLVCAILFVGGLIIGAVGLVGIYVGRVLRQVQGRPLYIVSEYAGSRALHEMERRSEPRRKEASPYV